MKFRAIILLLSFFILGLFGTSALADVKWNPGHYVMLVGDGKNSSYYMNQVYNELDTHPALRGIAIRYKWNEIEKTKGVYDFASIDKQLLALKAKNKQLIILLEYKSFTPDILIPAYMKTATYEGGVFATGKNGVIKGYNIKLWNTAVKDRLIALANALGKHLDAHPNFEGFGFQESTMGQPLKPLTTAQVNGFYNNLLLVNRGARTNFINTMTFQLTNYPRPFLDPLINELKNIGGTIGATDVFLQEPGLLFQSAKDSNDGLYLKLPNLNGILPILAQVEKPNYENTKHDDTGYKPTVTELLNFSRDKLFVNYILWTRSPGHYDDVLLLLNQKSQLDTPSGGLISLCPISIKCKI